MLADWVSTKYPYLLSVDEDFVFSSVFQGRECRCSFHGKDGSGF